MSTFGSFLDIIFYIFYTYIIIDTVAIMNTNYTKFKLFCLQKLKEWKDGLPDASWLKSIMPDNEQIDSFRGSMLSLKDKITEFEIGK